MSIVCVTCVMSKNMSAVQQEVILDRMHSYVDGTCEEEDVRENA